MSADPHNVHRLADHLFRHESGKMVAVLTRIFGLHNLDLAEDVVQEAFGKALQEWKYQVPSNPSGWLMQVAKNKAIDVIRKERHQKEFAAETSALLKSAYTASATIENFFMDHEIHDSQLRMIFACCHPELEQADQLALTLKTCSGFSVQEISSALLTNYEAVKKRLQRARKLISEKNIRFDIPTGQMLKERLHTVLQVIYLLFNEGYNSSSKEELIRKDLCEEAIRLSLLLTEHQLTQAPSVHALVALLSLLSSRFEARLDENAEIILLEDQDRKKWDQHLIQIGLEYLERSMGGDELSEYHLEAAIVAEHSIAKSFSETNWSRILSLYDLLGRFDRSPVVLLNRAIVLGKIEGPQKAIETISAIPAIDDLVQTLYLFPAVLGELNLQAGNKKAASEFFKHASNLTQSGAEKKLLMRKMQLALT